MNILKKQKEKKNILLLGATGQVGYSVTNELSKLNYTTTVLVRHQRLPFPSNVKVIEAKIFTAETFQNVLENIDIVIYGIGLPEQFAASDDHFKRVNYDILNAFLGALEKSNVSRMVYISTAEVFKVIDGIIREDHPLSEPTGFSDYFKSKILAYGLATNFAKRTGLKLTTIHPGAVYGGINTSYGVTNFIENLLNFRVWNVPFIMKTSFPIVHTKSLAKAIICSLDHLGDFIISEQMTSLEEIATTLSKYAEAYVPIVMPKNIASGGIEFMDSAAHLFKFKPIMSSSQLKLMTHGAEPKADHAMKMLDWHPISLDEGIQQYLIDRVALDKQVKSTD